MKKRSGLNKVIRVLVIGIVVFFNFPLTLILLALTAAFFNMANLEVSEQSVGIWLLLIFILSTVISAVLIALYFRKMIVKPMRKLTDAADKISKGWFDTRVELKGLNDFRNLGEQFNRMAEDLGGIEMMRKDFINNFSHEFKTPISSIHGFAKMLKHVDLSDEERTEYLDVIIRETERLSNLSTNILNISKIENLTILTGQSVYNLSEQIRTVIALLEPKWEEKSIEFEFDAEEIEIYANEELLSQVWINLIDNAIKFSPNHSVITLIIASDDFVKVKIKDQGPGVPSEQKDKIFEKFYQAESSRTTPGNGLGLSVVKKIIELHGGKISLDKPDSGGANFIVELPKITEVH